MNEKPRKSVLIVDDNRLNVVSLVYILETEYTIYVANNGVNAIKQAVKHKPDLILLDVLMPDMDGYEVIYQLKHSAETRHIPVVFITGMDSEDNEKKGLNLGAVAYIKKPFDFSEVMQTIAEYI